MNFTQADILRFRAKYTQGKKDECWLWEASCFKRGYGQFKTRYKNYKAHVVAFFIHYGRQATHQVCHTCDVRNCVNPHHLFDGTQKQNMEDKVNKGRQAKGESQHLSKFTESQVLEIRRRYSTRTNKRADKVNSIAALAREFGVFPQAIQHILSRKTWKHI